MSAEDAPRISLVGTAGLLFQAPGAFDLTVQARIWHMAAAAGRWPEVTEAVPGVTSLMLVFAAPPASPAPLSEALLAAWEASRGAPAPEGRLVEIPVTYGGAHGVDLAAVAAHAGLDPAEVVRRHSGAEYRVFALGSQPGFAYLGGLDPAIAVPRKRVPVLRVAAGTVVIGGLQAGIVAAAGPNGWHAIGHAQATLFDAARHPPALLAPCGPRALRPGGRPVIEVLDAATTNTVQDAGRRGLHHLGVGRSGAMDPVAFEVGNILLGNAADAAAVEVQMFPFSVRFLAATAFAVTGADCLPQLDDAALPPWWAATAAAGQVLRLQRPPLGARSYLAVAGGIDVPCVLGSRSTHLRGGFGGHAGRWLETGDRLATGPSTSPALSLGVAPPQRPAGKVLPIHAIPAAEHDAFPEAALAAFWTAEWRVSAQSNRHGYRLSGTSLPGGAAFNIRSTPILPGVVQVPPSGEPIVQMSDANSAGGYPKIATVVGADFPLLGQAQLGSRIRFVRTDYAAAREAQAVSDAYLARVRRTVALYRQTAAAQAPDSG